MPPLSAYTPLESLLFFQSLAAHNDTRPTSFVSISELLSNNKFVRENGAFDARRLSPEALEELYSNLMRDGGDSGSTQEPNGHHLDSSPSNPKKRKIATPRPDGLSDDGKRKPGFVPYLVSHLYAKYKEIATAEIRNEEKRFRDIKKEIERLEKEEREALREKPEPLAPTTATQTKTESVPEPMDLDTNETSVKQTQSAKELKPVSPKSATSTETKPSQLESQRNHQSPPTQVTPQSSQTESKVPAQLVAQQPVSQTQKPQLQPQPLAQALPRQPPQPSHPTPQQQPHVQLQSQSSISQNTQPTAQQQPRQPQAPNGESLLPPQQPSNTPQKAPAQEQTPNVQPPQSQKPQTTPVAVAPAPVRGSVPTASQPSQPSQLVNVPVPSPTPQKAVSAKASGKKGAPITAVTPVPQRGPPQASFQQWSLNQPQPSQPPSQPASSSIPQPAALTKPLQSLPQHQSPKVDKNVQPGPLPVAAPSTPQPLSRAVFQTPAPPTSGFATPIGPVQGFSSTGKPGSRPRLSINTPASSTPWKQAPHFTLSHSPRSPERPRPEDVSPISEKAPSPFGSRATSPEEPEPPRRRGPGRGRKKVTDTDHGSSSKKGEKTTGSVEQGRGRSTPSSRSRGRSVFSREDESGAEAEEVKREVPSTPVGINPPETEHHSTQKGVGSEPRPRGRPKRKRAPSEAPEPEAQPQSLSEPSQISRADSDQSAPFVLCARNFPRTGAPIMNDVLMHKHASIFTKPLTERDAPGYRDLIFRPQDLKSIKSSISQGSKSLAAATEAASTPVADGESPVPNSGTPSKNAVLLLQKTEDVIPPKAIVNSAQLEKELIRMFANAVMFNPLPQRGFGPAFPMMADGGSRKRQYAPEPDEGGIIKDTLEMFEDVEQAVTRWRAAERTADELATKSVLSLRRESEPNVDSDDVKG